MIPQLYFFPPVFHPGPLLGQLNGDPLGGAVVGDADEHNEPAGSVDQRGDAVVDEPGEHGADVDQVAKGSREYRPGPGRVSIFWNIDADYFTVCYSMYMFVIVRP
ncbi:hypothetical protein [Frankia sp. Cas4]|uniref:hypothetical protein n=1 Tax=Frankia sp. Cas4 TaxID=3073927 RepID=UPI002AD3F071|nr:hypothetical protein [Frankia sp. Cas4]